MLMGFICFCGTIRNQFLREVASNPRNYRHDHLRHGICVTKLFPDVSPNVSYYKDNQQILQSRLSKHYTEKYENLGLVGFAIEMHCDTAQPLDDPSIYDRVVTMCLIILFIVVTLASLKEGFARYRVGRGYDTVAKTSLGAVISCFSIPKNLERLGSPRKDSDSIELRCMTGLKFYLSILVMTLHAFVSVYGGAVLNPRFVEYVVRNPITVGISNGTALMQAFFAMAGWLLSYNYFCDCEGYTDIKFRYILHRFLKRYLRLTPCLLAAVAVTSTRLNHFSRGPFWDKWVGDEYQNCKTNWWTNLLYINNYLDMRNMCMPHTWYLAADMQLYLLSLVVLTFMGKYQKHTKAILAICLTVGIIIPGIASYVHNADILLRVYPEIVYNDIIGTPESRLMYMAGYTNIGGYMLGIMFGYLFYRFKRQRIFTERIYIITWWMVIVMIPLGVLSLPIVLDQEGYQHSRAEAAIYAVVARNIFAFAVCLLIYGISQGLGGLLRDISTWKPVQVLGSLSYCAYIVHPAIMRARVGQLRVPLYVSYSTQIVQLLGDITASYIFATFLCLFVEMPTLALQQWTAAKEEKKKKMK